MFDEASALTNCAMMGIAPSEFDRMPLWRYQAMLSVWNDRHDPDGKNEEVEAPDAEYVARRQKRLVERGLARTVH